MKEHEQASAIADHLGDDWWEESLKFWASLRGDITDLIEACEEEGSTEAYKPQLISLLRIAPYTSEVARQALVLMGRVLSGSDEQQSVYGPA